jgi:hypothetical protein
MMALAVSGMLQTHPSTDMFICPTPKMLLQVCGLEPPGGVLFISLLPDGACIPCMDDPCLHSLWMWQLLNWWGYESFVSCVFLASRAVGAQAMPEGPPNNRVLCGTFNADGTLFVTGSSDKMAGVRIPLLLLRKFHSSLSSYVDTVLAHLAF